MKTSFLLLLTILATATFAPGAIIAQWIQANIAVGDSEPEPWNIADNVTVSKLTMHGSITPAGGTNKATYVGWSSTAFDTNNYVGFAVAPEAGFELNLTLLQSVVANSTAGGTGHAYGYRIDEGSGFGDWVFQAASNENFYVNEYDLPDFSTTGTVEIGFFAWADSPAENYTPLTGGDHGFDLNLNGSVTSVPEPSAVLLGGLGSLVLLRRRR